MRWSPFGAQLLSCALSGSELFYFSPLSSAAGTSARGGVPVLFPQFADRGPLPKHGFARKLLWNVIADDFSGDKQFITFELNTRVTGVTEWPHHARLCLTVNASIENCTISLTIQNLGPSTFSWTGGLHPYFRVCDLRATRINGLGNLPVEDRYNPILRYETSNGPSFTGEAFERLYCDAPDIELLDGTRHLTLRSQGFSEWMVWNPGYEGARDMPDLPYEDWSKFVCIEPLIARTPLILEPGKSFMGLLSIA